MRAYCFDKSQKERVDNVLCVIGIYHEWDECIFCGSSEVISVDATTIEDCFLFALSQLYASFVDKVACCSCGHLFTNDKTQDPLTFICNRCNSDIN